MLVRIAFVLLLAISISLNAEEIVPLKTVSPVPIGTAMQSVRRGPIYWQTAAREFNIFTCENSMKPRWLFNDGVNFYPGSAWKVVNFAKRNGAKMRGHTLAWHGSVPNYIYRTESSKRLPLLKPYIKMVLSEFRNNIQYWDVVNEAIADDSSVRITPWNQGYSNRLAWIRQAFRWFHQFNVYGAKGGYNDYGIEELNAKSDAVYDLLNDLKARHIPIDYVGFQMHLHLDGGLNLHSFRENVRRFRQLGLDVHITEMDIQIAKPVTEERLKMQRRLYHDIIAAALTEGVAVIQFWGFTDKISWCPPGSMPLPFDSAFEKKPAYYGIRAALRK